MPARRFPPPWSVEELDACFVVCDRGGPAARRLSSTHAERGAKDCGEHRKAARSCCWASFQNCWSTGLKREGRRSGLHIMLISVVALPPPIDVPRTIPIGLTDTALHRPTRSAAVPSATAIVIVIGVMAVTVIPIRSCWNRAACCDCANDAHSRSYFRQGSHGFPPSFQEITRNRVGQLHE